MLSGKQWDLLSVIRMVVGLFVCLLVGAMTVQYGLPPGSLEDGQRRFIAFVISTLSFHGATLVLAGWMVRSHGETWVTAFGLDRWQRGGTVLLSLGGLVAGLPACLLLSQVSVLLIKLAGQVPEVQPAIQAFHGTSSGGQRVVFGLVAVVLAPVVEEILFRGFFYTVLKQQGFPRLAWWGTSILFAASHASIMTLLPLTFFALLLTWLYEKTGNLLAPMLTHAGFNLSNLLVLLYQPEIEKWLQLSQ